MPSMPFSVCSTTPAAGSRCSATVVGWPMPRLTYEPAGMSRAMMAASSSRSSGPRSRCSTVGRAGACSGHDATSSWCGDADRSRMRSTKMPGVTTILGVDVAGVDDAATPRRSSARRRSPSPVRSCGRSCGTAGFPAGRRRGHRSARRRRESGTRARSRGRRWCGSPCPRPAACRRRSGRRTRRCPRRPPGSVRRGCPAAPPRGRPCRRGTARRTRTSRPAAETSRSPWSTRPAASSAARPVSPLPALLLTMVRSRRALFDQRVDQGGGHTRHAEAADQDGGAVGDPIDRR